MWRAISNPTWLNGSTCKLSLQGAAACHLVLVQDIPHLPHVFLCCQVVTIVHIVLVVFIIIAGFAKSNPANLQPFAPKGARGIFNGAAVVFFGCANTACFM